MRRDEPLLIPAGYRVGCHLTQRDVAEEMETTTRTVRAIERGEPVVSDKIIAYAKVVKARPGCVLDGMVLVRRMRAAEKAAPLMRERAKEFRK